MDGCGLRRRTFTEMIVDRCSPVAVDGVDPSEAQLTYALHSGPPPVIAQFRLGDAMDLPFPDKTFKTAPQPLVIFFVPDPAKGVAEMARVVSPGGLVTAYGWDLTGGGFPYDASWHELRETLASKFPKHRPDASRMDICRSSGRRRLAIIEPR